MLIAGSHAGCIRAAKGTDVRNERSSKGVRLPRREGPRVHLRQNARQAKSPEAPETAQRKGTGREGLATAESGGTVPDNDGRQNEGHTEQMTRSQQRHINESSSSAIPPGLIGNTRTGALSSQLFGEGGAGHSLVRLRKSGDTGDLEGAEQASKAPVGRSHALVGNEAGQGPEFRPSSGLSERTSGEVGKDGVGKGMRPGLLHFLESNLGFGEKDSSRLVHKAIKWWQDEGSQREGQRMLSPNDFDEEQAEAVLIFLASHNVPVKKLKGVVEQCPELLVADVKDELFPLIRLLEGLKIKGKSLGKIIVGYPEVLLKGNWRTIAKIVEILQLLGIHESQVKNTIAAFPVLLCLTMEALRDNAYALSQLIPSGDDVAPLVAEHPSLLTHPREKFKAVCQILRRADINESQAHSIVQKEPRILVKPIKTMEATLTLLQENGLSNADIATMLCKAPQLLLCRVPTIHSKTQFLLKFVGRPMSSIVSFPSYYDYSIGERIAPRMTFLARRMEKSAVDALPLQDIIRCSDEVFAEEVAGALLEEYRVFQAQWQRLRGFRFFNLKGREPKHADEMQLPQIDPNLDSWDPSI